MFNPIVGISCGEDDLNFYLRKFYVKAVESIGGVPVLLPTVQRSFSREKYLSLLDGLILSGGGDVDPYYFKEEPVKELGEITPLRDEFEIFITKHFFMANKPILGVCRGIQVLNISLGGTIFQDINSQLSHPIKHFQQAPRWSTTHSIRVVTGTKLGRLLPSQEWRVNSFHHQGIKSPAPGFSASAFAPDGIIEGIEADHHPFAIGVQWHPECNWDGDVASYRLFQAFITACRAGHI